MPSDFDLRSLDEEPPTPSRVDVDRAIADGRRRRTRRGAGYAGAATLTVAAVVGASMVVGGQFTDDRPEVATTGTANQPAGPTSCVIEELPVPDGEPMAVTSGADPTGKYIVGRTYPEGGGYRAVIWEDGEPTAVDLPGDEEEILGDVNSSGTAIGWSYQNDESVPYVYSGGQVTPLPGVEHGSAHAINSAGAIVGGDADSEGGPVVWSSPTAEPVQLPLPEGVMFSSLNITHIDEDGTVVGNTDYRGGTDATGLPEARPHVWLPDGTHRDLPLPVLDGMQTTRGLVTDIQNGWAVGWVSVPDKASPAPRADGGRSSSAIRWNVRTGETRLYDEFPLAGDAVNAQGWQIGLGKDNRAVLVTDSGTVELPPLFDHEAGGLTNLPGTLSDDGRLVTGQSDDESGTIKPVVWRCE